MKDMVAWFKQKNCECLTINAPVFPWLWLMATVVFTALQNPFA